MVKGAEKALEASSSPARSAVPGKGVLNGGATPNAMPKASAAVAKLAAEQVQLIQAAWGGLDLDSAAPLLVGQLESRAPEAAELLGNGAAARLAQARLVLMVGSELVAMLDSPEALDEQLEHVRQMLPPVSPEAYPATGKAFLHFVWDSMRAAGMAYNNVTASAFATLWDKVVEGSLLGVPGEEGKANRYFNRTSPRIRRKQQTPAEEGSHLAFPASPEAAQGMRAAAASFGAPTEQEASMTAAPAAGAPEPANGTGETPKAASWRPSTVETPKTPAAVCRAREALIALQELGMRLTREERDDDAAMVSAAVLSMQELIRRR